MRRSARSFFVVHFLKIFLSMVLLFGVALAGAQTAVAQTEAPQQLSQFAPAGAIRSSGIDIQVVMVESLAWLYCQVAGQSPHPSLPCLSIDPTTQQLGYAVPSTDEGKRQVGGLLGTMSGMIATLYTPAVSSNDYMKYVASNFGIVKPAYAQSCNYQRFGTGYCSLTPILELWKITRNIAYFMLTIIFVLLGLAIMLRLRIDPRTVMTVQNQIPRIVICILLITFSYGIAGALIDLMWIGTYVGINTLTSVPVAQSINTGTGGSFGQAATDSVMQTPFAFFNQIMSQDKNDGIFEITWQVSNAIGVIVGDIIERFFSPDPAADCITWSGFTPNIDWKACAGQTFGNVLGFIATILFYLIILITILIILFRVWFELLKAYVFVIFYVITAPIWIVFGLIPGRPLGFEKWLRGIFANIAVFPMVVGLFIAARIFLETFKSPDPHLQFSPPLIGQPNIDAFGAIIAFGVLLMSPTFLNMLRDALKVPSSKYTGAIMGTVAAGAAVPHAITSRQVANWNRRDQAGRAQGPISKRLDKWGTVGFDKAARLSEKIKLTPVSKILSNTADARREFAGSGNYYNKFEQYADQAARGNTGITPSVISDVLHKDPKQVSTAEAQLVKKAYSENKIQHQAGGDIDDNQYTQLRSILAKQGVKNLPPDRPRSKAGGTQGSAQATATAQSPTHAAQEATPQNMQGQKIDQLKVGTLIADTTRGSGPQGASDIHRTPPKKWSETATEAFDKVKGDMKLGKVTLENHEAIERMMQHFAEKGVEGSPEEHRATIIEYIKEHGEKPENGGASTPPKHT